MSLDRSKIEYLNFNQETLKSYIEKARLSFLSAAISIAAIIVFKDNVAVGSICLAVFSASMASGIFAVCTIPEWRESVAEAHQLIQPEAHQLIQSSESEQP